MIPIFSTPRQLDYQHCRYNNSKIFFRGPARCPEPDQVAFVGGSETFGRFVETPFCELIERSSGIRTLNLGCADAGIDAFLHSPGVLSICSSASATVIQVMSALNMSNRYFTVDKWHNQRFIRASKIFKALYPEVDFTQFETGMDLLSHLARTGPDRLHLVRQEVQCAWVARMKTLLELIDGPKILLWMSDHAPFSNAAGGTICREPLFIDRAMLKAVRPFADALVEVVADRMEIEAGRSRMIFPPSEANCVAGMLGPLVHDSVAQKLEPVLQRILPANLRLPTHKSDSLLIA